MIVYRADRAFLPSGWAENVRLTIDDHGTLSSVEPDGPAEGAERIAGIVIPGMANLHSHAFQRAMAGLAERAEGVGDSFWTWRQVMYGFVDRLGPDQVRAIAAWLQVEMLKAGYTAVAEFHYLHNQPDGMPYGDPSTLSAAVIEAAGESGIALTHMPVLYMRGGFDGRALSGGQARFAIDPDRILGLLDALAPLGGREIGFGLAIHSLRAAAVTPIRETLAGWPQGPVHIHVAEQPLEVEECLATHGARPVAYLMGEIGIGPRWCLVHATHITPTETRALAASGAVAGLCPSTEGNLGDGFFPLETFLQAGGRFGIGSDSHVSIDPREELRWLDYGQRLVTGRRSMDLGAGSIGARLWRAALDGGAQALGRDCGRIAVGARADLLVLDPDHPSLFGRSGDRILDSLVFAHQGNPIRHVMVGGTWVIRDGAHRAETAIAARYRAAITHLAEDF
jgi:formimidoylglutamate deiminase